MNIQTYIPAELETLETILQTMAYGSPAEQTTLLSRLMESDTNNYNALNVMVYLSRFALDTLKEHLDPTEQEPAPIAIMLPDMREAELLTQLGY